MFLVVLVASECVDLIKHTLIVFFSYQSLNSLWFCLSHIRGLCNPKGVFMLRRNILLTSLAVLIPNFVLASEQTKTLKIGVTAGLHAQILEQVLPIAKKNGLNIKIVEFQDYQMVIISYSFLFFHFSPIKIFLSCFHSNFSVDF